MIHVTMSHRLLIGVGMKKGEDILKVMKNDLYTANERIKELEDASAKLILNLDGEIDLGEQVKLDAFKLVVMRGKQC